MDKNALRDSWKMPVNGVIKLIRIFIASRESQMSKGVRSIRSGSSIVELQRGMLWQMAL